MRCCNFILLCRISLAFSALLCLPRLAAQNSVQGGLVIDADPTDQTVYVGQSPTFTIGVSVAINPNTGMPYDLSSYVVEYWWFINRPFDSVPLLTVPTTQVPDYRTSTPYLTLPAATLADNGMQINMGVGVFLGPTWSVPGAIADGYIAPTVRLTVIDKNLVLTASAGTPTVSEDFGSDSFDAYLNVMPTANVTVTIIPPAQVTVSPTTLTFTTANYTVPQTITVRAVNDNVAEPASQTVSIQHTLSSGDPGFNGKQQMMAVTVIDDDPLNAVVTESGGGTVVFEGGATDSFTIQLNRQPSSNAVVNLSAASAGGAVSLSATALAFTPSNWNIPIIVTVTAVEDAISNGVHIESVSVTVQPSAAYFVGPATSDISMTIYDNDAGVAIQVPGGRLTLHEGGVPGSYNVVLSVVAPTADVTVKIQTSSLVNLSTDTLTFTPTNWNLPQAVMVTPVDDALTGKLHVLTLAHTVTSVDPAYDGKATTGLALSIVDNDKQKVGKCAIGKDGPVGEWPVLAGLILGALLAAAAARRQSTGVL